MAGKPSLVELQVRLSLSQREKTEVRDYFRALSRTEWKVTKATCPHTVDGISSAGLREKAQRAKHTSDPIFPAPGTLLSTALPSGSLPSYVNFIIAQGTRLPRQPKIKEITNSTRNIKNRSFAMPADAAAIPPNPKTAATSAMIRKTTAHPNISSPPKRLNRICRLTRVPLHAVSTLSPPTCRKRKT